MHYRAYSKLSESDIFIYLFFFFLEISFDISAKHAINSAMGNFYRINRKLNISSFETGHGVVASGADTVV